MDCVVCGKGEVADISRIAKPEGGDDASRALLGEAVEKSGVVEVKGTIEGVGVDDKRQEDKEQEGKVLGKGRPVRRRMEHGRLVISYDGKVNDMECNGRMESAL